MKILLHACCGPCLVYPSGELKNSGDEFDVFFYNPNIHPFSEYARRREALYDFCGRVGASVSEEEYDYKRHLKEAIAAGENRCAACYRMRLTRAAAAAKVGGYDAFSTTLLVSPYQRHDEVRAAGEEAAALTGAPFLYVDWRSGFREGQRKAREMGLYSQKYCGCLFSEEERFSGSR